MKTKAKILIVEDESVVALNIENRLLDMGYEIADVVITGEEAIAAATEKQPDLVLMDIQLTGEIDGIQAAELIRDRFNIPVIYLTAYGDEETLQRAKVTEPYGYIIKPFEAIGLGSAIAISLYKHRIDAEIKSREQWLSTTLTSIGDGVITTDKYGAIAFMNPVAEKLTGWHQSEALGNPLSEVFKIIEESTGEFADNPGKKAIKSGEKVALKNHQILIAKDGKNIPIDDSAAPIKDEKENVTGAVLVFHDIIERKQAELALRNSEERFRSIFDRAFNLMWLLQPDGTVLSANQTVLDLGKIQSEKVVGCQFWQGNWWRLSTATCQELQAAVERAAAGEIVRCEVESRGEKEVVIDLSIKPIAAPTGKVVLLIVEGKDISDRKRAEAQLQTMNDELEKRVAERTAELQQTVEQLKAEIAERERTELELRKSQRFIESIADTTPNILYIYDLIEQKNIYTNRQITTILGYRPEEIKEMGQTFLQDLMHPEDFAKLPEHFSKLNRATDGDIFEIEYRMRDVWGQWRWLVSRDTVFSRTQDGKPQQIIGAADDITSRKQVEEKLKLRERAIAASNNGMIISDARLPDLPAIYVNPAFEQMTGYTAAETIGRNCRFLQNHDKNQPELNQLRTALRSGTNCTVSLRNYRKDSTMFWNNLTISPIYDEQGNLTHYIGIQTDITERKEAEEELQATTSRLTALMENLQLGVLVKDELGKIVLTNQAFCDLFQITATPQALRGSDFSEFARNYQHLFANGSEFIQRHYEIRQGKKVVMGEELQMASGRTLERDYAPIFVDGNYAGHLWMYRDISDRKQTESALLESEARWHKLIENTADGILVINQKGIISFVNPAAEIIFGSLAEELLGEPFGIPLETTQINEISIFQPDGSWITVDMRVVAIKWEGEPAYLASLRDISERKQAEAELEQAKDQLQAVLDAVPGLISWISCPDDEDLERLEYIGVNRHLATSFNLSPEAFIGQKIGFLKDRTQFAKFIRQFFDSGDEQISQEVTLIVDGKDRDYLIAAQKYDRGKAAVSVGIDISDRKQMELELTLSKQWLQYLLACSPAVIYSRKPTENYGTKFISENVASILGYAAEEFMLDKSFWRDRIHPDDREKILTNLSTAFSEGEHSHEYRFQHQNGSYRWLYDEFKVVRDHEGKPIEMIGYWADITDRKQAEALLKASLEEKETLLKEIHHRVKNNLQIISSLLRLQSRKIQDREALKSFTESQNRVQVMALVHEQLLNANNLAEINFPEYIQILVGNLFRTFDATGVTSKVNIEAISLAIDTAIPCGLIVNELVSNSLKYAFPEGRTGWICISLTVSDSNQYILSISDNGVGIPASLDWTQTRSLGLQLVRKLTNQLEGEISLDRSQGTEFRLIFGKMTQFGKMIQK